ncbi:hypothetical protein GPL17_35995 [Bradyrhizobium yuanmingense]|uniref:hypothetical protein n=1 Tax=Bradyrhizobium yuanmingense TaxID=108015 RepID=UPI0012FA8272|nr:hypothetical protein [Bradyrhizobium yuanmingense]MDF0522184.1 hypothetical protein [Bradyrhizobium yuanmingense]MVT55802.1 hypothetical protein [Bradyrhizobium yuanmingense]
MTDPEHVRSVAEENYRRNQQTPMASEQAIPDAITRNTYNAELARQRANDGK